MACRNWFHRFTERNKELTIKNPEGVSRTRIDDMKTEKVVDISLETLELVVDKTNLRVRIQCERNGDFTS